MHSSLEINGLAEKLSYIWEKSKLYLELLQKFDFQPLITKPTQANQLLKTGKFCPWGGFQGGIVFFKKLKKFKEIQKIKTNLF